MRCDHHPRWQDHERVAGARYISLALRHTSPVAAAWWRCAWVPPEPARTVRRVESYLPLAGRRERGTGALRGASVQGAAAWFCLNSHLGYTRVTASSGTKVVAGIARSQRGAEVVMATALRSQFSLLGIELWEQNRLVSSITKCGNINDGVWALLHVTKI